MGFDVSGISPTEKVGKHFSLNVWGWHPLADFVCRLAPDLAVHCKDWHTNDGDGLNAGQASELASRLTEAIETGFAANYVKNRNSWLATLKYEACPDCGASGFRFKHIRAHKAERTVFELLASSDLADEDSEEVICDARPCPDCAGRGFQADLRRLYSLDVDRIRAFRDFVAASGGFSIY